MIGYYDSDEEIAWGELTRPEILNHLLRRDRYIERRNSDPGEYRIQPRENQSNGSGSSAYFALDESLQTRQSTSKNQKPINGTPRGMGECDNDDLDNLQQSFVDDTIIILTSDSDEDREQSGAACVSIKQRKDRKSFVRPVHHAHDPSQSFVISVKNEPQNLTPSNGRSYQQRLQNISSESLEVIVISDDEVENRAHESSLYKDDGISFSNINQKNEETHHENIDTTILVQSQNFDKLQLILAEESSRTHSFSCRLKSPKTISSRCRRRRFTCGNVLESPTLLPFNIDSTKADTSYSEVSKNSSTCPYFKNRLKFFSNNSEFKTTESATNKTPDADKGVESRHKKQYDIEKLQSFRLSSSNLDLNDSLQNLRKNF